MSIDVICPQGHKLKVSERFAGRTARCPKCDSRIAIPELDSGNDESKEFNKLPALPVKKAKSDRSRQNAAPDLPDRGVRDDRKRKKPAPIDEGKQESPKSSSKLFIVMTGSVCLVLVLCGGFFASKWMFARTNPAPAESAIAKTSTAKPNEQQTNVTVDKKSETKPESPAENTVPSELVATNSEPPSVKSELSVTELTPEESASKSEPPVFESKPQEPSTPAKRACEVVELPSPMKRIVVGGSGRFLIATLPALKQVIVIDVLAKNIRKSIHIDDGDTVVAAGETKLVILQRDTGVISRFNLDTGERELTIACDPYTSLAMGSSSEGPILAYRDAVVFLDLQSLKPTGATANLVHGQGCSLWHAAANGKVFGGRRESGSPTGLAILQVADNDPNMNYRHNNFGTVTRSVDGRYVCILNYEHNSFGNIFPSPDGRVIYTGMGRFSPDARSLERSPTSYATRILIPGATGPFFLSLSIGGIAGQRTNEPTRLTLSHSIVRMTRRRC
jgi:hypothetical protein